MPYPIDQRNYKRWQYVRVDNLLGGINVSKKPDQIDNNQTIHLSGVKVKAGGLETDSGYSLFGAAIVGTPQVTHEFVRRDLTTDLLLVTTSTVYKWNVTLAAWHLVKGTAGTTSTAPIRYAGSTIVTVASASGFTTGDLVSIVLDDTSQLQTTITVSGLQFTLADAVPVGRTIPVGAVVNRAVSLTGTLNHQVTPITLAGSDWFVFTNGIDTPKRFDGADCIDIPNLPSGGNTICETIAVYNTALFLFNTTEGGTNHAQRIRRSDQTDPTNWTTGTAGFDDLLDNTDAILAADLLGPYIIVYRDRSIVRGSFVGSSGLNYYWESMVTGEGAVSTGSVVNMGDFHILVGHANVYEYLGDFALKPIGDNIYYQLFGFSADMNPVYRQRLFALYVEELDELWILYPSSSSVGTCDKMLRYNIGDNFWYSRQFSDSMVGYGFYTRVASLRWMDLVGSWLDQTWAWNSRITLANNEMTMLCSDTAGQVVSYDYTSQLDNTTAIEYTVETKDFTLADSLFRLDMIEMFVKGTGVLLQYSTDSGISWNNMATITQALQDRVRVYRQLVTNKIRFRWSGTSVDFALEWFGFSYKVESIY